MLSNLKDRIPESTGSRSFFKKGIFLIILFSGLGLITWYANQLLVALIPEGDRPIEYFRTYKGDEWNIRFTHSVQLTPVEEFFRVNGIEDLVMTHTKYESLGVGLPYAPSEGKFSSLKKDGRFDLEMNRPYKSVKLRTAVQAQHQIIHGDTVYDLCKLYGQGTLVEVKVLKRYQLWLGEY